MKTLSLRIVTFDAIISMNRIKYLLRKIATALPFAITQNIAYDKQTKRIMELVLRNSSNCIDIGCHKGEVLEEILELAPNGQHFGFEPIPHFFQYIQDKFPQNCSFFQVALSNQEGEVEFNYVLTNPAFSGLKQRAYPKEERVEKITVKTQLLDNIIPKDVFIDLIKIDVEGAELGVLQGGVELISRCKPTIIFEHGLGAADHYGTKPSQVFEVLNTECGLEINTLKGWLQKQPSLSLSEFEKQFNERLNYYFIASAK